MQKLNYFALNLKINSRTIDSRQYHNGSNSVHVPMCEFLSTI